MKQLRKYIIFTLFATFAIITAAFTGGSGQSTPDFLPFPPGYAVHLYIRSAAELVESSFKGLPGRLAGLPSLKTPLELVRKNLGDEIAAIDEALSGVHAGISCSEIARSINSSITLAIYPGKHGGALPDFLVRVRLGGNSDLIRKSLGRVAASVEESGIPDVRVKASPLNGIPCHEWELREPAISLYTAYFSDFIAIASDPDLILSISGRGGTTGTDQAVSRLRSASHADSADAVLTVSTASLGTLLQNRPSLNGVVQKIHEMLERSGIKRFVWTVDSKDSDTTERLAIEGLELPRFASPLQVESLKQVPGYADIVALTTVNLLGTSDAITSCIDSAFPGLKLKTYFSDINNRTGFDPMPVYNRFGTGQVVVFYGFNSSDVSPAFGIIATSEKPEEAKAAIESSVKNVEEKSSVESVTVEGGNAFVFSGKPWEPFRPAFAVINDKIYFMSSVECLKEVIRGLGNSSLMDSKPVRGAAAKVPLDSQIFLVLDLDAVVEYEASRLPGLSGGLSPEMRSELGRMSGNFDHIYASASSTRWGILVEVQSRLSPGIPIIALSAGMLHGILQNLRERRIMTNETAALAALRSILVAEELYRNRNGSFAKDLSVLARERYIDDLLSTGFMSGYLFEVSLTRNGEGFEVTAKPVRPGWSGMKTFQMDESGSISEK